MSDRRQNLHHIPWRHGPLAECRKGADIVSLTRMEALLPFDIIADQRVARTDRDRADLPELVSERGKDPERPTAKRRSSAWEVTRALEVRAQPAPFAITEP